MTMYPVLLLVMLCILFSEKSCLKVQTAVVFLVIENLLWKCGEKIFGKLYFMQSVKFAVYGV